jgi:sugar lactone lactonase YvrE
MQIRLYSRRRTATFINGDESMKPPAIARITLVFGMMWFCISPFGRAQGALINTLVGSGQYGFSGGAATSAIMDGVYAIAVNSQGTVYLADSWNNRIRVLLSDGMVTTIAGTGETGFAGDGGAAIAAKLNCPRGIAVDSQGNIYFSDSGNSRIRKIDSGGKISTIAGTGSDGFSGDSGLATAAQLNSPRGLAIDAGGNLYIADGFNFRIRMINAQGKITTIAGMGAFGQSGDGGPATSATIGLVQGLALDKVGNLYLVDVYNHCVRKVLANGNISTIAGGGFGTAADGELAINAHLRFPQGIAADAQGTIYVADSENHRVWMIGTDGIMHVFAGTGTAGFSGDGSAAYAAQLNCPYALAIDPEGGVLISDLRNYRLRRAHAYVQPSVYSRYFPILRNLASQSIGVGIANLGNQQTSMTFRAYAENSALLTTPTAYTLQPKSQLGLMISEMMPSLGSASGWMEMQSDTPNLNAFFLMLNPGPTEMDGAVASGTSFRDFVFPVVENAVVNVANPGGGTADCTLQYVSSSGSVLNSKTISVASKAMVPSSGLATSGATTGYLHGSCSREVTPIETFGRTGWMGALSASEGSQATGSATTLYAPQYVYGGGYTSTLRIINLESTSYTVTLTLIGDNGATQGSSSSVSLPAHGSAIVTGTTPFGLTQGSSVIQGYVKMESTAGRFTGAVIFTDANSSQFGSALSFSGFGAQAAYFSQIAQTSQYWTGLAAINLNESEVQVTVRAYDVNGNQVDSGIQTIPAKGRLSKTLSQIMPKLPSMSKGYFVVNSPYPVASFALFGTTDLQVLSAIPSSAEGAP